MDLFGGGGDGHDQLGGGVLEVGLEEGHLGPAGQRVSPGQGGLFAGGHGGVAQRSEGDALGGEGRGDQGEQF